MTKQTVINTLTLTDKEQAEVVRAIDAVLTPEYWPFFGKALNALRQRIMASNAISSYGDIYSTSLILYDYVTKNNLAKDSDVAVIAGKLYDIASRTEDLQEDVWREMLTSCGLCTEDANGNRPCDRGELCDRCDADWFMEAFHAKLSSLGLW